MEDIDALIDALIEDTWHWICPRCKTLNEAVAGNDDMIVCRCGFQADPETLDPEKQNDLFLECMERALREAGLAESEV